MSDFLSSVWSVIKTMLGLALVVAGIATVYWGERGSLKANAGRDEFITTAKKISPTKIDPANQGKPVVLTGKLQPKAPLEDPGLGVKIKDVVVAYRIVAMMQLDEQWASSGDDEQMVGYSHIWGEEPYDCPSRPNPPFPISSKDLAANDGKLGAFTIPRELVAELEPVRVVVPDVRLNNEMKALGKWDAKAEFLEVTKGRPEGIGDLRISYKVLDSTEVTVMGTQQGDRIAPFIDMAGGQTYSIAKGQTTPAALKQPVESDAGIWASRILSAIPLWIGLALLAGSTLKKKTSLWIVAVVTFVPIPALWWIAHVAARYLVR